MQLSAIYWNIVEKKKNSSEINVKTKDGSKYYNMKNHSNDNGQKKK